MNKQTQEALEQESNGCGNCHACLINVKDEYGFPATASRMILCPECGNKRCPKASNHRYGCTHSNEVGQAGSFYTRQAQPLSDDDIHNIADHSFAFASEHFDEIFKFARAIEQAHGIGVKE